MRFLSRHKVILEGMKGELLGDCLAKEGLRLNVFDTDQGYLPTLEIVNIAPYMICMVFRKTGSQGLTLKEKKETNRLELKSLIIGKPGSGLFVQMEGRTTNRIYQIRSTDFRDLR